MSIFEILAVSVLIVMAFAIAKISLKPRRKLTQRDIKELQKHWSSIKKIKTSNPTKAILDADKLLNLAFKKRGVLGSTGNQLKKAGHYVRNLQSTWDAHKLSGVLSNAL